MAATCAADAAQERAKLLDRLATSQKALHDQTEAAARRAAASIAGRWRETAAKGKRIAAAEAAAAASERALLLEQASERSLSGEVSRLKVPLPLLV